MEPFRYHIFVCCQVKPEGVPGCAARGSGAVLAELRRQIAVQGLTDAVQVTTCGSLGLCESGPNMIVYPEGIWYSGVQPADAAEIVTSHLRDGIPVERLARLDNAALRAEIIHNRDKFLAAQRAKQTSGAVPDEILQTIRGFQESRVILTAVELDVFTAIGSGAVTAEIAGRIGTDARATGMLLNALVSMQLLTKQDGIFRNTPVSARHFVAGSPDDARAATIHTVNLWQRWSTLTECVRKGTAVSHQEMVERGESWTGPFIAAMDRNATERAPLVVRAVGAAGVSRMLDVGGGSGAYSIAFAKANPELQVEIFDLPTVTPLAMGYVDKAGLMGRIRAREGDLRTDDLGTGFDLVFVSAICHMLGPDENRLLVKRCYDALAPGGRLVIQDFLLEADKTAPKSAALFSLNMLVGTQQGSSYSVDEYAAWLNGAGFAGIRHVRLPGPSGLMIGTRS
jgi:(2Fe-2S) ferredoxin/SAM-dependent methyltransferase